MIRNSLKKMEISVISAHDICHIEQREKTKELGPADEEYKKLILENIGYKYQFSALKDIPSKISASGIAEKMRGERVFQRPSFLYSKGMTPAEKGSALHLFMQYCDLEKVSTQSEEEISRLQRQAFITRDQAQAIDREKLNKFISSDIFTRMISAEKCFREYRFTVGLSAGEVFSSGSEEVRSQDIILQGAFDLLLIEKDGLVIIDYKTDRTQEMQELYIKYHPQLDLYKRAAEEIFKMPVKESFIYSFYKNETLKI
jgi:ATP-dependent helicase/nuclease subunit A